MARNTVERRALIADCRSILILLDTGLRASELCNIRYRDINMTTNAIKVVGKGNKERIVYFARGNRIVFSAARSICSVILIAILNEIPRKCQIIIRL